MVESDGEESVWTDTDDDGAAGSAGEAEDEDAEDATSVAGEDGMAID